MPRIHLDGSARPPNPERDMPPKPKKNPRQTRKVSRVPAINPPTPAGGTEKYWSAFKALLANRRFFLLLSLFCIPVGIAAQVSFIKFRCVAEPFLGAATAACKDNMLRMIVGGPLVLLVALGILAWVKQQKKEVHDNILLLPFVALLPTLALPFIHQEPLHDNVILVIKFAFTLTFVFVARHKLAGIFRKLFGKPEFRMDCSLKKNDLTVVLEGRMLPEERTWIFERTLATIGLYGSEFNHIAIDCRNLKNLPMEYAPIVDMLLSFARFSGKSLEILGGERLSARSGNTH